jgi:hypothetical protein
MILSLVMRLAPRKSLIFGEKSVGVVGLQPNTYLPYVSPPQFYGKKKTLKRVFHI